VYFLKLDSFLTDVYHFPPLHWDAKCREYKVAIGKQLSYQTAFHQFKKLLLECGLPAERFGLRSSHIGGATNAFYNHVPSYLIDLQGRWKSSRTKFSYLRIDEKWLAQNIESPVRY